MGPVAIHPHPLHRPALQLTNRGREMNLSSNSRVSANGIAFRARGRYLHVQRARWSQHVTASRREMKAATLDQAVSFDSSNSGPGLD